MKKMISLALVCLYQLGTSAVPTGDIRDSVVKIHVTQRQPDFLRPWRKSAPTKISGSGVLIEGNRILTNAHVVHYARRIQVQPNQSTEKFTADLVAFAQGIDLAVITVRDKSFYKTRKAIPLGDAIPKIKASVSTYGYPIGGEQQSITEGIVSRIEYTKFFRIIIETNFFRIKIDAYYRRGYYRNSIFALNSRDIMDIASSKYYCRRL